MYLSRPPKSRSLLPFIEAFWTCETNHAPEFERVLPHGRMQLLINLEKDVLHDYQADGSLRQRASGMVLRGPALAPIVIDRAEQKNLCGVLFSPNGAFPYLRVPVPEIGAGLVDFDSLITGDEWFLRERLLAVNGPHTRLDLLEAAFLNSAPVVQNWDIVIREATGLLRRGRSVRSLAEHFGTTQQTLIARFRERTGMTPKTYARIERFQSLVRNLSPASSWADAALDAGFADQSHMVREFGRFAEIAPTGYQPHSASQPNHVAMPT